MNDDTRGLIMGTIIFFLCGLVVWLGIVYISACSFTLNCIQGAPLVVRTSIPTLIPRETPQGAGQPQEAPVAFNKCQVSATDLIGAWVAAGHTENEPFPFTDVNGQECQATYADIQPGEICALFGSTDHLELAANSESAADRLKLARGGVVEVSRR